jgi:hypothetical protein
MKCPLLWRGFEVEVPAGARHGFLPGVRRGAGHENTGSDFASAGEEDYLVPGGRDHRHQRPADAATIFRDIVDAYKKNDVIESFLTDTSQPEIDIEVKNVALEGMEGTCRTRPAWTSILFFCSALTSLIIQLPLGVPTQK